MARALWSGNISFGLVTIPIQLYAAIQEKKAQFHLLTSDGRCRLRQKLYCPETGDEYDYGEAARGYEIGPDQYVLVDDDELERLKPESSRTIDIQHFVELSQIDTVYFNRPYYVAPKEHGQKPYKLLVHALMESGRVALAKMVMREREYLVALRARDGVMILETMYFADEIRSTEDLPVPGSEQKIDAKEARLALQLVESLVADFNPGEFRNEYRERVEELIEKKAKGRKVVFPEQKYSKQGKVIDLMEALRESLKDKPKSRQGAQRSGAKGGGTRRKKAVGA